MNLRLLLLLLTVFFWTHTAAAFDLEGLLRDLDDEIDKAVRDAGKNVDKAASDVAKALEKATNEINTTIENSATRIFAGPSQYPPEEYAAHAMFAFPARPSDGDEERYQMFCEAYISVIPHASEVDVPKNQQLVTVWPIENDDVANHVNRIERGSTCTFAVLHYGFLSSRSAIVDAEASGLDLSGKKGPFLIAWAPPADRGVPDQPILYMDLSTVSDLSEAKIRMAMWVKDIEEDPDLWKNGWEIEKVRFVVANWANRLGEKVLFLFTG